MKRRTIEGMTTDRDYWRKCAENAENALREALAWTRADLRHFDEIAPDRAMLRARARVLSRALGKK